MMNLQTIAEALGHLEGTIVGSYINGETVFITDSRVAALQEKVTMCNTCLRYVAGFEDLKFTMFMRQQYSEVKDMKFNIVFRVNGFKTQKCNVDVPRLGFKYLSEWFMNLVQSFIDIENIVYELNSLVRNYQNEHGTDCQITYGCDYTRKDEARLAKWDYSGIKFEIGMNKLLNLCRMGTVKQLFANSTDYYESSIIKAVKNFNTVPLHAALGAKITGDPRKMLSSCYKNINEVIRHIIQNRGRNDAQVIPVCTYIDELGKFLVLTQWEVNYDTHNIDIDIVNKKIYDIESDRFISQGDIYDRIYKRVQLPEYRSPVIFGDMTVEEFLNS